ncbi:MAG TPA: tripartite tricarboxylate transporter substrate binding protein [Burkholderiales bacterium]|nr:tripartite tricarboxylate transporter substrate binding protein [Burkholderiales bacterium]
MRKLLFAVYCLVCVVTAQAADRAYPSRPIRIIVPFAAGGPTDIVARTVGQQLTIALAQPVVIDNRPGAGGVVGADLAAKSAPDGYTLLLCSTGAMAINPALLPKMPYDALRDLSPITLVVTIPYLLLVNPAFSAQSVKDVLTLGRAKPGQLNYGSAGTGTTSHLAMELFRSMAGIQVTHVPYKGSALAATDLVGGQLQLLFDAPPSSLPFVRSGKLRAIGISTLKRTPLLPEMPTISEAGVPGYEVLTWSGICAPSGTPNPVIARLNQAIVQGVTTPETRERFAALGADVVANSADQYGRFIRAELAKWARVIREAGVVAH